MKAEVIESVTRTTLVPGMVLLETDTYGKDSPCVWTVTKVNARGATLIAYYGSCSAEAKLRTTEMPDDWHLIPHGSLVDAFRDWPEADEDDVLMVAHKPIVEPAPTADEECGDEGPPA